MMSVEYADMISGTNGETRAEMPVDTPVEISVETSVETPDETPDKTSVETSVETPVAIPVAIPVQTPVSIPVSLGAVGYAAFALLQAIPLSEIVPFCQVVSAFEAEGAHSVAAPAPVPEPVPEPISVPEPEPEPEPEPIVAVIIPPVPPVPEPAIVYTEGGYRPAPGPQLWGRKEKVLEGRGGDLTTPASPVVPDRPSDDAAVGVGPALPLVEGYGVNRAGDDRKARQVLDELSFLFDGN